MDLQAHDAGTVGVGSILAGFAIECTTRVKVSSRDLHVLKAGRAPEPHGVGSAHDENLVVLELIP